MIFHDKTTKLWACRYGEMGNVDFNMLLIEVSTSFKHQTKFSHSIRRILNIFNGRRGGKCFFTEIPFCDSSRNRFTWLCFALPMSMLCDQKVKWIRNSIFYLEGNFGIYLIIILVLAYWAEFLSSNAINACSPLHPQPSHFSICILTIDVHQNVIPFIHAIRRPSSNGFN